jgi:hypothetical protein
MRSARFLAVSVATSLVISLLTQLNFIPSAHACSTAPEQSQIKIVWGPSGAPTFEIKPAKTGSLPTTIQHTYSLFKVGDSKYGEWADWVSTNIFSLDTVITLKAPSDPTIELISVSAYATNSCGNSMYTTSFRLLTYKTLIPVTSQVLNSPKLSIAEDLPISIEKIPFRFFYPSGIKIPQTLTSKTPAVCKVDEKAEELQLLAAGSCEIVISQNNDHIATPNPDVTHILNILPKPVILPGVERDRPDEVKGFQVHFVYVTLANKPSSNFLENGLINTWLDLANAWLKRKISKQFIFDTYQGAYDISILKSVYVESDLMISSKQPLELLRAEFAKQNGSQMLGKNIFFIIDGKLSNEYCGLASTPGNTALSTPGSDLCWYPEFGFISSPRKFNSPSSTIAHELIHNLGVGHPCENPSDLMYGSGCDLDKESGEEVIDEKNSLYVGADEAGANILDFKVWRDGSGKKYIPLNGVCYVGEPCMVSNGYWNSPQGDLTIQEKIGGKWRNVKTFKVKKIGVRKYSFNASIIPSSAGIHTYRETLAPNKNFSAYVGKPFTRNVVY